ncbi:hypothetical protein C8J55DRAFT_521235 [Lentinula edodes]|uniref:Uncharacterized protein n=1 Tax=Lentinula lateritia TaxID=40482 RepID=A0A9W9DJF2_9AGAR|nr:hypothetical protein C8J55DRAFT_521235 [Lentinula edodes]
MGKKTPTFLLLPISPLAQSSDTILIPLAPPTASTPVSKQNCPCLLYPTPSKAQMLQRKNFIRLVFLRVSSMFTLTRLMVQLPTRTG